MKESSLWLAFKAGTVPSDWVRRVESIDDDGLPDVHALLSDGEAYREAWVELKSVRNIKSPIGIRTSQRIWHNTYAKHGGQSFILIQVLEPHKAFYLYSGADVRGLYGRSIAGLSGGLRPILCWMEMRWILEFIKETLR